jgi:hypothetical protein
MRDDVSTRPVCLSSAKRPLDVETDLLHGMEESFSSVCVLLLQDLLQS